MRKGASKRERSGIVKERPILFSAPMVRALLDGSKTQTRRICKQQPYPNGYKWDGNDFLCHNDYLPPSAMLMDFGGKHLGSTSDLEGWESECPYGQPGDRLWVRETFVAYGRWETRYSEKKKRDEWHFIDMTKECDRAYQYAADNPDVPLAKGRGVTPGWYKRAAIFMPSAASRILLEIVSVRVERLQDISDGDARAEGIADGGCVNCGEPETKCACSFPMPDYRDAYCYLWEQINGAGSWDANPWVWCVGFRRVMP